LYSLSPQYNGKDTYKCQKVNREEDKDDDESSFVHILASQKYEKPGLRFLFD